MNDQVNPTSSKGATNRDVWGDRVTRWLTIATVLVVGVFLLLVTVISFGTVRGEEFSPNTFRRRSFYYVRLPLVKIQITPVFRTDTTSDLEQDIAVRYLKKPFTGALRWDLVFADSGGSSVWKGDARILCNYLDQRDDDGEVTWKRWSKDNPELAALFWPAVAELAQLGLYYSIPDLVHQASEARDPNRFKQQLAEEEPMKSVRTPDPRPPR